MVRLLAEQPILLSVLLAIVSGACFYGWMQSGERAAAIAGLVFLLLIPVGWIVSTRWVTDREQIISLIRDATKALEANDFERVFDIIAPDHKNLLNSARSELEKYEFSKVKVGQFRSVRFFEGALPPEAEVDLMVSAIVTVKNSSIVEANVPRRVILRFRKKEDRWWLHAYTHRNPTGAIDGYTPNNGAFQTLTD